jgi:hypothetical protein
VARRIKSLKNSSDPIKNRTHDLPACRAVPQPTVPPCTPMCRWENNIKMDLQEAEREGKDLIDTPQYPEWGLVNALMNLCVLYNARNFLTSLGPISLLRRTLLHSFCHISADCNLHTYHYENLTSPTVCFIHAM